jgi:hypothetical protein
VRGGEEVQEEGRGEKLGVRMVLPPPLLLQGGHWRCHPSIFCAMRIELKS